MYSFTSTTSEVGVLLAANKPDVDPAGVLHRRAADIYAETVMLVEKVENVRERRRLEVRLKHFRRVWNDGRRGKSAVARVASKLNRQRAAVGCTLIEEGWGPGQPGITCSEERLARKPCQTAPSAVSIINCVYVDDACGVRGGDALFSLHRHFWWPGMQIPPSLHSITMHRLVFASI
jgi:hypothetical protein